MSRRWLFLLTAVLLLLLAACAAPGGRSAQSQATAPPDATHLAVSFAPATPSPTPAGTPTPATKPAPAPTSLPGITVASGATPPPSCPVTQPSDPPFTPPPILHAGNFRYGTPALWTQLRDSGVYTSPMDFWKIFWGREGYGWRAEQRPDLTLTARRLDGPAPAANAGRATNAGGADVGSATLNGIDLPTLGCWEFTALYRDTNLTFVIWLTP